MIGWGATRGVLRLKKINIQLTPDSSHVADQAVSLSARIISSDMLGMYGQRISPYGLRKNEARELKSSNEYSDMSCY